LTSPWFETSLASSHLPNLRYCYISCPLLYNTDICMTKKVKGKKLNASVKPVRAVPRIPAGKWTSTLES
jgi:hypothetical protein